MSHCYPTVRSNSLLRIFAGAVVLLLLGLQIVLGQSVKDEWPTAAGWAVATPKEVGLREELLEKARRYALTAGGSGLILRHGQLVLQWGDQRKRYDIKSATKSFGATMLGVALQDSHVKLGDLAVQHHSSFGRPPNDKTHNEWAQQVTLLHLATQTAGFDKPGGYEKILFEPGSQWHYSDGGPNWLAECLTLKYDRDLEEVMFERVFTPIGITREDLQWRSNQYREHHINGVARREFGAGIHANVQALSRFGYLYLREGRWQDQQLLTKSFIRIATQPVEANLGLPEWAGQQSHGNASEHYGLLWWNNADGTLRHVPRDAYWAWGLYDSLVVVIPSLDLVVVRGGQRGRQLERDEDGGHYDVLAPLLEPIVAATGVKIDNRELPDAPYPASPQVIDIRWEPPEAIVRKAPGSDNWPVTWGDDGRLYTAYGDGWGFTPRVKQKLSLGLAVVEGDPPQFRGTNLASSIQQTGDGPRGKKASGMLMVDGVLYMLLRNSGNAELVWSEDRGHSWHAVDWKWTTSFGCPAFVNFGRNYSGRPAIVGDYVYVHSQDSDSAYEPADRMVMARVPKNEIRVRDAYQFFSGIDSATGEAQWSPEIRRRQAIFVHAGNCYRSGMTYNEGLRKFLWCQTLPQSTDSRGPRFQGGFGIYESSTPWGPWRTVFYTTNWDVGPGETSSFPTKWMQDGGTTLHLVFSGDDHFSVRKATLLTRLP